MLGSVELGRITAPFTRGKLANGTTENRGAESTVGNLVAEVQRWATETPTSGSAQIAMMNPGGLRADMLGNAGTPAVYPAVLTYRQAANTQPFANTLVNMSLTGAQIKTALEQQWQPAGAQRPFLRLGLSEGLTYTYDPTAAAGSRITQIWLNGTAIDPVGSYSVTVNSFLAAGGDNFTVFAQGTNRRDTGKVDLQAMVDYMATFSPVAPDYTQRSVGVVFPAGAPATYQAGETVTFNLTSLAMTNVADVKDTELALSLAGRARRHRCGDEHDRHRRLRRERHRHGDVRRAGRHPGWRPVGQHRRQQHRHRHLGADHGVRAEDRHHHDAHRLADRSRPTSGRSRCG